MIRDSLTKRLWLHIFAEGGRWTRRELSEAIAPEEGSAVVHGALNGMVGGGALIRHDPIVGGANRVQFSVTEKCTAPGGITVAEFTEAAKKAGALS